MATKIQAPTTSAGPKPRIGRYGRGFTGKDDLPHLVRETMLEDDPDWDWWYAGEYVVLRLFDGGEEIERIAAKVVGTRVMGG